MKDRLRFPGRDAIEPERKCGGVEWLFFLLRKEVALGDIISANDASVVHHPVLPRGGVLPNLAGSTVNQADSSRLRTSAAGSGEWDFGAAHSHWCERSAACVVVAMAAQPARELAYGGSAAK